MSKKNETEEINPIKVKHLLQYKFSDEEINSLAKQLAFQNKEAEQLKSDKKATVANFDSKIKVSEAMIMSLSGNIANGSEYRKIECDVFLNKPNTGIKSIVRNDTGESWTERMSEEELQERIFTIGENDNEPN